MAETYTRENLIRDLIATISIEEGTPIFPGPNMSLPRAKRDYALELVQAVTKAVDGVSTGPGDQGLEPGRARRG